MIFEMLAAGPANAISATHLARVLGVHKRDVSKMIERERREGRPICATCNSENPGYFLPADPEEMQDYINRLRHREAEIAATREALTAQMRARAAQAGLTVPGNEGAAE